MHHRHLIVIRLLVLIGLVALLAFSVDLRRTVSLLADASVAPLLAALLLVQGQIVLSAFRWRFTAQRLGQTMTARRATREYYLATFLNGVLPGGPGGDAVRTVRATRSARMEAASAETPGPAVLRAVVLERLAGQVAFFVLAAAGMAFWPSLVGGGLPDGAIAALALPPLFLIAAGAVIVLLSRFGPLGWRRWIVGIGPDIGRAWISRGAWLVQGALSLAIAGLYIAVFALASLAIGAPLTLAQSLALVPLVLLTMLLPVSIGGFGLREGAAAALWPLAGFSGAEGLAAGLLYGLVSLAGALPGALVLVGPRSAAGTRRA